jgi:hypothetical protein
MQYDQHKHTLKKCVSSAIMGIYQKETGGKKPMFQRFFREKYHKRKFINVVQ